MDGKGSYVVWEGSFWQNLKTASLLRYLRIHAAQAKRAQDRFPMAKLPRQVAKDLNELPQGRNTNEGAGVIVVGVDKEAIRGEAPNQQLITIKLFLTVYICKRFITE